MNTKEILASKKTEHVLWILIIGTFILSLLLNQFVVDPKRTSEQTEPSPTERSRESEITNSVSTSINENEDFNQQRTTQESVDDVFADAIRLYPRRFVTINGLDLQVAVASSEIAKTFGLSDTKTFPTGIDGLLFPYESGSNPGIWMKDMNYSINIYWLDDTFGIVHEELSVSPDTYPTIFRSPTPASYVLETAVDTTL